jgi:hypothetical protein
VNELKKASKCIRHLIRGAKGLDDGIAAITADMRRVYRFSDVGRFNRDTVALCYAEFEEWMNSLAVSRPMPQGIVALYFGMYDTKDGIVLHVAGSSQWDPKSPYWTGRHDWFPEEGIICPALFKDISMILSRHSYLGYYLAVTLLAAMIKEYVTHGIISLLDDERQSLCIACGFEEGEIFNVGELLEEGFLPLDDHGIWVV